MSKNVYYQLKKPVYGKYGFEGFEDYRQPCNTIEEARNLKNLSVFGEQLEIFEITLQEQIVKQMKRLVIGDIHGQWDGFKKYVDNIKNGKEEERREYEWLKEKYRE